MSSLNRSQRGLIVAVAGALIVGSHGVLIAVSNFQPFMAFNAAIGVALIWFGVLISSPPKDTP